jgi:glycosyltransferase involved in cell wall biosynthesis
MPANSSTKKVLIISHDRIGFKMAGTGIRYHYMAEVLSKYFDVTVGFFGPQYLPEDDFKRSYDAVHIDVHQFHEAFAAADIVIALWVSDAQIAFCNDHNKLLVFDIYAPVPVETLALKIYSGKALTPEDDFAFRSSLTDYRKFLANGDAFLYSNQRQLDFWLGYAFGAGQVTPETYKRRDVMNQFILAPMGIDTKQPLKATKRLYKDVVKGITSNDIVMIWSGGIYDWYDGVVLMDAMKLVKKLNPRIKLVFPGTKHPNDSLPKWRETIDTIKRAEELGIRDDNVFFFENWIPYQDRVNFILEADMAVYTHRPSVESEFSHRTRVLDSHIFGTLPTVATVGDHFADVVEREKIGLTVPPDDPETLAKVIVELAKPEQLETARKNLKRIRPSYDWEVTLRPLVEYLQSNPHKVEQIEPLKLPATHKGKLNTVRKYTPVAVKKGIIRVVPHKIRRRIVGR